MWSEQGQVYLIARWGCNKYWLWQEEGSPLVAPSVDEGLVLITVLPPSLSSLPSRVIPWAVRLILLVLMNLRCEGVCHMALNRAYSLGSLNSNLGDVVSSQAFTSCRFFGCSHRAVDCNSSFEERQSCWNRASQPGCSVKSRASQSSHPQSPGFPLPLQALLPSSFPPTWNVASPDLLSADTSCRSPLFQLRSVLRWSASSYGVNLPPCPYLPKFSVEPGTVPSLSKESGVYYIQVFVSSFS